MSRRPLVFAVLFVAGLTGWAAVRPSPQAAAAPGREAVAAGYAVNDEETAAHRWAPGQTRHWRQLVVKR